MFKFLKSILGSGSAPGTCGQVSEAAQFLRNLGDSTVFVIGATQSEGIDAKTMTKEQLLAEIRKALEKDEEDSQRGYNPFVYVAATGQRRLPVFASQKHAQVFSAEYSKERHRVFPFMVLGINGKLLASFDPASFDVLAFNDRSPDERLFTPDDLAAARRLWQA